MLFGRYQQTDSRVCIDRQKTQNNQQKNQRRTNLRTNTAQIRYLPIPKKKKKISGTEKGNTEIKTHKCDQLIFDKGIKVLQ